MSDQKYNGWTNYATWRVNLEIFDGTDAADLWPDAVRADSAYDLAQSLEEYADSIVTLDDTLEGLAVDYARAFLKDVNWQEIAEHLLDDIRQKGEA